MACRLGLPIVFLSLVTHDVTERDPSYGHLSYSYSVQQHCLQVEANQKKRSKGRVASGSFSCEREEQKQLLSDRG